MNEDAVNFSVAILAGGHSRRMGTDKALLSLNGVALIERVLAASRPLEVPHLLIANNPSLDYLGLTRYADRRPDHGPLGGLYTALDAAPTQSVLLLACDLPFITTAFLRFLASGLLDYQAVIPADADGSHPLCALYDRSCLVLAQHALQEKRLRLKSFLKELDVRYLAADEWRCFDPYQRLLANLNTPEQYRYYQEQKLD